MSLLVFLLQLHRFHSNRPSTEINEGSCHWFFPHQTHLFSCRTFSGLLHQHARTRNDPFKRNDGHSICDCTTLLTIQPPNTYECRFISAVRKPFYHATTTHTILLRNICANFNTPNAVDCANYTSSDDNQTLYHQKRSKTFGGTLHQQHARTSGLLHQHARTRNARASPPTCPDEWASPTKNPLLYHSISEQFL